MPTAGSAHSRWTGWLAERLCSLASRCCAPVGSVERSLAFSCSPWLCWCSKDFQDDEQAQGRPSSTTPAPPRPPCRHLLPAL